MGLRKSSGMLDCNYYLSLQLLLIIFLHVSQMLSHLVNCHSTITLIVSKLITLRSLYNHWCVWEIRESQCNCLSKKFIESELTVGHNPFGIGLLFLDALKIKYQVKINTNNQFIKTIHSNGFQKFYIYINFKQ